MSNETQLAEAIEVFFSYAHEDEDLRDELEKHLSILKRQGVITGWHDRRIGAGREWEGEIDAHLNAAQVILLLVSADFVASDYCWDIELKWAMERHEDGEARVIPVILRPVDWEGAPFGKLEALPTDAKPVTIWPNQDEAFLDIAQGIRAAVEELAAPRVEVRPAVQRAVATAETEEVRARLSGALQGAIVDHEKLFGVGELVDDIQEHLLDPNRGWIISLFGEGGVGKTALAYEVVKRYGEQSEFTRFAWVSAKQRYYSITGELKYRENVQLQWVDLIGQIADQLGLELGYSRTEWLDDFRKGIRQLLPSEKSLIVIDNLETVEDIDVVEYLGTPSSLNEGVIKPHKVIITTRKSVMACSRNVIEVEIKGLKPHNACDLIRFLGRGNKDIETATNEDLRPILNITEGNPLLIKLVVNRFLVRHVPLGVVLDEIRGIDPQLKDFLYLQSFRELERVFGEKVPIQLMTAFCPRVTGELLTYDQLFKHSGIPDKRVFKDVLKLACDLSLIRVSGLDARYSIHSLLWEFVCKEETDATP
jgi:hypothetical protein